MFNGAGKVTLLALLLILLAFDFDSDDHSDDGVKAALICEAVRSKAVVPSAWEPPWTLIVGWGSSVCRQDGV